MKTTVFAIVFALIGINAAVAAENTNVIQDAYKKIMGPMGLGEVLELGG